MSDPRFQPDRFVGFESRKAYARRCAEGFWDRYAAGPNIVDVGYRGGVAGSLPLCDGALGVDIGSPGYNGFDLPVPDGWADAVHASHVLEHVMPADEYLREWFRALRVGGHMILFVPSAYLYERRLTVPPSRWSPEHLCSFTPATLMDMVERTLAPNSYRVRHLADNDAGYDYSLPVDVHPVGGLEIEIVIQKITPPSWSVEP